MANKDKNSILDDIQLDLSVMLGNLESAFEETPPLVEEIIPVKKPTVIDLDKDYGGLIADLLEDAAEELVDEGLPVIIEKKKTFAENVISGDYKDHILNMISDMSKEFEESVEDVPDKSVIFRDVISDEQNEIFTKKNEEIQLYLDGATQALEEIEESSDTAGDNEDVNMSEYISALKDLSNLNERTMNYNTEHKDFSTFEEMRDHYKEFIKMVDVRLRRAMSLGGGGSNYGPGGEGGGGGESRVSTDPNNYATLGSDGGIYVAPDPINPVITYDAGGALTRIDYDGVSFKEFTYNADGSLSQLYYNRYGEITVKDYIYNDSGKLTSVTQT